jgi:hypothetical protein
MKVDYSNSKIYKISNDYNDDVYIGSTCDSLTKRFSYHKSHSILSVNANRPLYKLINEIGFDRFRIQLILNFPCEDKYQLRQKEGEYIRQLGTLNQVIAGRTKQTYREETREKSKEHNKEYNKEYYQKNKEKIIHHVTKEYYIQNRESICEYKKKFREENIERLKEKDRLRYNENKNKILEPIICECGCNIAKKGLLRHQKSQKHIDHINKNN